MRVEGDDNGKEKRMEEGVFNKTKEQENNEAILTYLYTHVREGITNVFSLSNINKIVSFLLSY